MRKCGEDKNAPPAATIIIIQRKIGHFACQFYTNSALEHGWWRQTICILSFWEKMYTIWACGRWVDTMYIVHALRGTANSALWFSFAVDKINVYSSHHSIKVQSCFSRHHRTELNRIGEKSLSLSLCVKCCKIQMPRKISKRAKC